MSDNETLGAALGQAAMEGLVTLCAEMRKAGTLNDDAFVKVRETVIAEIGKSTVSDDIKRQAQRDVTRIFAWRLE